MARHKARRGDRDRRLGGYVRQTDSDQTGFPKKCQRKAIYATKKLARDVLLRTKKRTGDDSLEVYRCTEGGTKHFHIGHPKGWHADRARSLDEKVSA